MNNQDFLLKVVEDVNGQLDKALSSDVESQLLNAMRYSVLGAGKRIRPLLVVAGGVVSGAAYDSCIQIGAAIELIHSYSLIHDDLPSMDDDDLRRGRLTCHKKFNEGIAILAGDALQSLAFEVLSLDDLKLSARKKLQITNLLGKAIGINGMALGQALDLASTGGSLSQSELEAMHGFKTGRLIEASILSGYIAGDNHGPGVLEELVLISKKLGLLFQIVDDVLDGTQSSETLGKTANKDQERHKVTYVTMLGLDKACAYRDLIYQEIMDRLVAISDNEVLLGLVNMIYKRHK